MAKLSYDLKSRVKEYNKKGTSSNTKKRFNIIKYIVKSYLKGYAIVVIAVTTIFVTAIVLLTCVIAPLAIKDLVPGIDINNSQYAKRLAAKNGYGAGGKTTGGKINLSDFEEGTKGYWYAKMSIATGLRPGFIEAIHMCESSGRESGGDEGSVKGPFQMMMPEWEGTEGGEEEQDVGPNPAHNDFNGDGTEDIENWIDAGAGFAMIESKRAPAFKQVQPDMGQLELEMVLACSWNWYYDAAKSHISAIHQGVQDIGGESVIAGYACDQDSAWSTLVNVCPPSLKFGGSANGDYAGFYALRVAAMAEYYNKSFYTRYSIGGKDWPADATGGATSEKMSAIIQWAMDKCNNWQYNQGRRMDEGYVDCSSLVYRAFMSQGIDLLQLGATGTNTTGECTAGEEVPFDPNTALGSQVQPGDLVFCNSDNSHVVMCIGDGKYVGASQSGVPLEQQIHTGDLSYYQDKVYAIRRIPVS